MSRLIGLFTTKAYAEPASETPLLGRKLRQCLDGLGLIEGSHDYKAAVALFDTFPKDELFAAPADDLRGAVRSLLALEGTDRVRLLGRRDVDGRNASLILTLPRGRYDAALVERVRALFRRRFGTSKVETHHVLDDSARSRVHFLVHAPGELPELALRALEAEVIALSRTWDDELRDLLIARQGPVAGRRLAAAWLHRFPDHYKGYTSVNSAAHDIACFGRLAAGEGHVVSLQPLGEQTRVSLYKEGEKVELSEAMPMLEDLGLRVIEELSTRLTGEEDEVWVQEFRVLGPDGAPLDVAARGAGVAEVIAAVWRGDAESDPLNRLVVTAGLDRRQLGVLRAYRKYRQRVGSRFTEGYQNDVLVANSKLTAKLVRYFEARFDPSKERDETAETALREEILADLEAVVSLDHDRILRNQLSLIDATLRTSAFKEGRGATAFKLRSADVPAMPQPAPLYEIYVYSSEMEGIHLRGGQIARGGIRWSDRMDYRTEVYGLMRAQLTKNAVIVPAGAKGGFIVKHVPADRDELKAEVENQYKTYVRSLLDVTDNLVDGEVVHPPQVRALDGDDTYLVVAADKGTATFSDTANAISREYGFWLDDAFASGGSAGYDHKKLGITARGAWESVKRHFRELDMDPAEDEFTAVGIGDMSGDVFGNGMLLSDKIRLVAAYDHRHVFIDPSPDAAASFAERKRLLRPARLVLGRLRPLADLRGRRRVAAQREVDPAVAAGARGARHRRGARGADGPDPRDPARAGRPALERRHRHRRQGLRRDRRRRARPLERRDPRRRPRAARPGRGGGRQPRLHAPGARGVLLARRAHQRGLHRQLRRGRLLRPRGQPQDPARARGVARRDDPTRPRRAARGGHRGRRRARALRLVPAGADHRPGGRALGGAAVRLRRSDGPARRRRGCCSTAAPRTCRTPRRSPTGGGPGAAWSARSWRCWSPTRSAGWRGRWRPRSSSTTRGSSATCTATSRPR